MMDKTVETIARAIRKSLSNQHDDGCAYYDEKNDTVDGEIDIEAIATAVAEALTRIGVT